MIDRKIESKGNEKTSKKDKTAKRNSFFCWREIESFYKPERLQSAPLFDPFCFLALKKRERMEMFTHFIIISSTHQPLADYPNFPTAMVL